MAWRGANYRHLPQDRPAIGRRDSQSEWSRDRPSGNQVAPRPAIGRRATWNGQSEWSRDRPSANQVAPPGRSATWNGQWEWSRDRPSANQVAPPGRRATWDRQSEWSSGRPSANQVAPTGSGRRQCQIGCDSGGNRVRTTRGLALVSFIITKILYLIEQFEPWFIWRRRVSAIFEAVKIES